MDSLRSWTDAVKKHDYLQMKDLNDELWNNLFNEHLTYINQFHQVLLRTENELINKYIKLKSILKNKCEKKYIPVHSIKNESM